MNQLLLACAAALALSTAAQAADLSYKTIPGASPEPIREGAGLKSPQDLETFLDGVINTQLRAHNLAGVTLSVVKNGQLYFAKGYGFADVAKKIPVDADKTLFRPGSTSKLFTWIAVMQLVEQGKLDLDADVNQYLTQFKLPTTQPNPVTLRNLLTHTPGLEDGGLGYLMARTPADVAPLDKALADHMPARIFAPTTDFTDGRIASYSNWGCALAGLIVANVSGMTFEDYIAKNILSPLGMTRSTFLQPPPAPLLQDMSVGYSHEMGAFKAHDFELINGFEPAGSMSATATDMAKFMIANLNKGALGEARILKEETATLMQSRQFSPSPYVAGSGLGFYEEYLNGYRMIGHGGDSLYFHTQMVIVPELDLGIFVSYNSAASLPIDDRGHLVKAIMDRYYPAKLPELKPRADFQQRAAKYAGSYRSNRHSRSKVEKFIALFVSSNVVPTPEGTLLISNLVYPGAAQWIETSVDGVFREVDGDQTIAFVADANGNVTHMVGPFAFIPAYRVSGAESSALHYAIYALAILGFVIAIVSALRNWKADRQVPAGARRARRIAALTGLVFVLFLVGIVAPIASLREINEMVYGLPSMFYWALALPLIGIPLAAAMLYFAVSAWRNGYWTRYGRIQYTVITLATLAFLWSLHVWNLVGYKVG
jgi:CubicO group peptidase (beta-lactamase class C family)